jgi:hypothetical protein
LTITEVAQIFFALFYSQFKLSHKFDKKWAGLHFGPFFYKLIWSPCSRCNTIPTREEDIRVTRLGEFTPISRLFTLGVFDNYIGMYRRKTNEWATFSSVPVMYWDKKIGWATFLSIFLQTRLVTLYEILVLA